MPEYFCQGYLTRGEQTSAQELTIRHTMFEITKRLGRSIPAREFSAAEHLRSVALRRPWLSPLPAHAPRPSAQAAKKYGWIFQSPYATQWFYLGVDVDLLAGAASIPRYKPPISNRIAVPKVRFSPERAVHKEYLKFLGV